MNGLSTRERELSTTVKNPSSVGTDFSSLLLIEVVHLSKSSFIEQEDRFGRRRNGGGYFYFRFVYFVIVIETQRRKVKKREKYGKEEVRKEESLVKMIKFSY